MSSNPSCGHVPSSTTYSTTVYQPYSPIHQSIRISSRGSAQSFYGERYLWSLHMISRHTGHLYINHGQSTILKTMTPSIRRSQVNLKAHHHDCAFMDILSTLHWIYRLVSAETVWKILFRFRISVCCARDFRVHHNRQETGHSSVCAQIISRLLSLSYSLMGFDR